MSSAHDDPGVSLREARASYFAANNFGDDGGYAKTWEIVKLGPIPIPIRNLPSRVAAIRFHDLHHVLTGYATDLTGEAEISAWEIASGCKNKLFAWVINLQGMLMGVAVGPARTYRAFVRGRHSQNLYAETFGEELLARQVGPERTRLALDDSTPAAASLADKLSFAGWMSLTTLVHLSALALPVALAWWFLKRG